MRRATLLVVFGLMVVSFTPHARAQDRRAEAAKLLKEIQAKAAARAASPAHKAEVAAADARRKLAQELVDAADRIGPFEPSREVALEEAWAPIATEHGITLEEARRIYDQADAALVKAEQARRAALQRKAAMRARAAAESAVVGRFVQEQAAERARQAALQAQMQAEMIRRNTPDSVTTIRSSDGKTSVIQHFSPNGP